MQCVYDHDISHGATTLIVCMYNIQVTKVNSNTNTDIYTIWGNEADKTTVTALLRDKMAGGSLFLTTDKTGDMVIYKWDENLKDWSEL